MILLAFTQNIPQLVPFVPLPILAAFSNIVDKLSTYISLRLLGIYQKHKQYQLYKNVNREKQQQQQNY